MMDFMLYNGQMKMEPVDIFRYVAKSTIEEIILAQVG